MVVSEMTARNTTYDGIVGTVGRAITGSRTEQAARRTARAAARCGLGASVGGTIVVLSLAHGGYAPAAWGWTALLALWVSLLALVFRSEQVLDRAGVVLVGGVVAVAGWTALSAIWTQSVPRTMLELERDLVYVAVAAVVLLLCDSRDTAQLVWGLCAGLVVVAAWALGVYFTTRSQVDLTQGYLLFRPVGYANALGGLVALALPLVLAFAAHDQRRVVTAAAGASTVVLSVALYLTQNRSGSIALGIALVVWIVRTDVPEKAAAAILTLAIPAGGALVAIKLVGLLDAHRQIAALGSTRFGSGAIVIAFTAIASVVASRLPRVGLPSGWISHRSRTGAAFAAALAVGAFGVALVGTGDRAQYWRAAWRAFERHPLVGSGAGTFDEQWLRYRGTGISVHDAHSLYLETLSELGVVGLLILGALLAFPIVVSRRTRDPLTTACLASYCAFLVHAAFEWDWEMPVVTVSGLVLASALVRSRTSGAAVSLGGLSRVSAAIAVAGIAAFSVVALVGNTDVVAAEHQIERGDVQAAAARATQATQLLPWASEPWLVLADARARGGDLPGSRAALRAAVARDNADWALWLRLAAASRGSRRAVAFRRAVALNPRLLLGVGSSPVTVRIDQRKGKPCTTDLADDCS
jgi:hypothetical protein